MKKSKVNPAIDVISNWCSWYVFDYLQTYVPNWSKKQIWKWHFQLSNIKLQSCIAGTDALMISVCLWFIGITSEVCPYLQFQKVFHWLAMNLKTWNHKLGDNVQEIRNILMLIVSMKRVKVNPGVDGISTWCSFYVSRYLQTYVPNWPKEQIWTWHFQLSNIKL